MTLKCIACGKPAKPGYHHCPACLDGLTLQLIAARGGVRVVPFTVEGAR
jgi:hypothetical protein